MKLKKTYPYAYFGALILMPVYLFIVVAHLFFVPSFQGEGSRGANSFKKNIQLVYYLVRNDRSTMSENKNVKTFSKIKAVFAIEDSGSPLLIATTSHHNFSQFSSDDHESWLTNRTLRI